MNRRWEPFDASETTNGVVSDFPAKRIVKRLTENALL